VKRSARIPGLAIAQLRRSPRREEAWACRAGSGGLPVFDIPVIDRPIVDYRATLTADCERIKWFDQECAAREAPPPLQ
jgi:hypothetical protein